MKPENAYKYCLLCGSNVKKDHEQGLTCVSCHFEIYNNPAPCNAVILENDAGDILLVKRRVPPKKGFWDIPGGFMKAGEDFPTSVKREIKEELGCEVADITMFKTYVNTYLYQGVKLSTLDIYATARIVSGTLEAMDDIAAFKFFPKNTVLSQKLAFPTIEQALTDYIDSK